MVEWLLLRLHERRMRRINWWWYGEKDGKFSIKSLCKHLEPRQLINFPFKVIWSSRAPPKAGIFAWEAT